jgi:dUTPase
MSLQHNIPTGILVDERFVQLGSKDAYFIRRGDKIAQILILKNLNRELEDVGDKELSSTVRGTNGFGSTGK